jgi:diadenosine tetraphosphate (Ap4A) HIT family hydrolase
MARFQIHPQLLLDCHAIGKFALCHLLLHRNAAVPWFILVPETEARDLLDLAEKPRTATMNEAAAVSDFVKKILHYPKINFAAIGNVVPQLHLHVVGRKPGDPRWPAPVWGHLTDGPEYSAARLKEITSLLVRHCTLNLLK